MEAVSAPQHTPPAGHAGPSGRRVLVVEDERAVAEALAEALGADGHVVTQAASGAEARAAAERDPVDLVLLDVRLPDASGFDVFTELRERSTAPIIFLTALGELDSRLRGFDLGADDYIEKPFELAEVVRRVRAVLRRVPRSAGELLAGPYGLVVDTRAHEVRVVDQPVGCTSLELNILQLLLERRGEAVSADDLARGAWGHEAFGERNFIEAAISRLRAKLADGGAANVIETVRGVGYVIRL